MYTTHVPYNILSNNDKIVILLLKIHKELTVYELSRYANNLTNDCTDIYEADLLDLIYAKMVYTKTKLNDNCVYYSLTTFGDDISQIILDNIKMNIYKISTSNRLVIDVTDAPIDKILEIQTSLKTRENVRNEII